jgi:hypothetical protein
MAIGTGEVQLSQIRTEFGGATASGLDLQDYYRGGVWPTGMTGVFNSSNLVANFRRAKYIAQRISNSTGALTQISPPETYPYDTSGLTASTTHTAGGQDDGYWQITLPWSINFLGVAYTNVFPATNNYITFGTGSTAYSGLSTSNPPYPKIMWGAGDRSAQRIYYGARGTSPNRTYRIITEGNNTTSGTLGSPTVVSMIIFYENDPNKIDIIIDKNSTCDLANLAAPNNILVPSTNSANNTIPINGIIGMNDFKGTGTAAMTLNTFNTGTLTMSAYSTFSITSGSGKSSYTTVYDYGGWRQSGYDSGGSYSGTGALGSGTAGGFSIGGQTYNIRAWYIEHAQGANLFTHYITFSSISGYPSTTDGRLVSFTWPYRNPSTGVIYAQSVNFPAAGSMSSLNFTVGSDFCTRISVNGVAAPASSTRHNASTAYSNMSLTYYA